MGAFPPPEPGRQGAVLLQGDAPEGWLLGPSWVVTLAIGPLKRLPMSKGQTTCPNGGGWMTKGEGLAKDHVCDPQTQTTV